MPEFLDQPEEASRQYIDAVSVFTALEEARLDEAAVRGSMFWKSQDGVEYLIRSSAKSSQRSLGKRASETEAMYESFHTRKTASKDRVAALEARLESMQRLNKALRVGRVPNIVVDLLNTIAKAGLSDFFMVVGTHALYAYEAEAGVRILNSEAMATQDVDLLWDTRKRIQFIQKMGPNASMLGLLQKVDPTFRLRSRSLCTAVNASGFEVDIIRREAIDKDPHPLKITDSEEDFWVVQAKRAGMLLSSKKFSSIVVSTTGQMARMTTVMPSVFVSFKRWMSEQPDRDAKKTPRDRLQAQLVEALIASHLPHLASS
ncbi:MAG: hypothetical protein JWN23_3097 [Rhodocyclales bacterium]|nr:hypothetical protein [Rhodocyclales bacterium]